MPPASKAEQRRTVGERADADPVNSVNHTPPANTTL